MQEGLYKVAGVGAACGRYGLQKEAIAPLAILGGAAAIGARALPLLLRLGPLAARLGPAAARGLGAGARFLGRGAKNVGSKIWNAGLDIPNPGKSKAVGLLNAVNPLSSRGGLLTTGVTGAGGLLASRQAARDQAAKRAPGMLSDFILGPNGQPIRISDKTQQQFIV